MKNLTLLTIIFFTFMGCANTTPPPPHIVINKPKPVVKQNNEIVEMFKKRLHIEDSKQNQSIVSLGYNFFRKK